MTTLPSRFLLAGACALSSAAPLPAAAAATAADQAPTAVARPAAAASIPDHAPAADITKPAFTTRVGGSPADAAFRAAIQQSGDDYRERRAACDKMPASERGPCLRDARAALDKARADAKTAHDEAVRSERGARQQ